MSFVLISESAEPVMNDNKETIRVFPTREEAEAYKVEVWNSDQVNSFVFEQVDKVGLPV